MSELFDLLYLSIGCIVLIVAVMVSFWLGRRSGRIDERRSSSRFWKKRQSLSMFRDKFLLASYKERVVSLEEEIKSFESRSDEYERAKSELACYQEKIEFLERSIGNNCSDENGIGTGESRWDESGFIAFVSLLREDPLHANPSREEWIEFIATTDMLFNGFISGLKEKYNITRHEQEICCLIKWNFTRKQQLSLFNNTPDALTKSKGRLKKRLGLEEKTDLDSYIRSI